MNLLELYIAKLVDAFKTGNPKIYAIIVLVLGTLIYSSENGLGDVIGYDLANIVKYISIVLGFLTGSRTTAVIKQAEAEAEDC
jgi:hypothetical protein